jgi:hypothetical protein
MVPKHSGRLALFATLRRTSSIDSGMAGRVTGGWRRNDRNSRLNASTFTEVKNVGIFKAGSHENSCPRNCSPRTLPFHGNIAATPSIALLA